MSLLEAIRLAIATIRVQKLKSFFTALGVCIGVMFLIAVVSIVDGMGRYMEEDLVGKLIAINSFEVRARPNINIGDVDRATWLEYNRRPHILESDVEPIVAALPPGTLWSMYSDDQLKVESPYSRPRQASITAIEGDYFAIKRLGVTEGRLFTPGELTQGASVVVIGPDLAKRETLAAPLGVGFMVSALIALRVSFGLAATAVGAPFSPREAWAFSRGSAWAIVATLFLIYFAGAIAIMVAALVPHAVIRSVGADTAAAVIAWAIAILVSYAGVGIAATAQAIIFRRLTGWREGVPLNPPG